MNENPKVTTPTTIGLADILYVVFRHKWKIVCLSVVGIAATAALPFFYKPIFESEAKLLIKYVVEGRAMPQVGGNQPMVQPIDDSGQGIINTELEILSSSDLAQQVADAVGPERILAKMGGGNNRYAAAAIIQNPKNLVAESPKRSNVIRVAFRHPDPVIAQAVLNQLIESYVRKHAEIHRGGNFDEFLTQETDQLHSQLLTTEETLRKEKDKLGIISIEQTRKFQDDQIIKIREKLLDTEAQLAEKQAAYSELSGRTNVLTSTTTFSVTTNNVGVVSADVIADYKGVCGQLESLRKKEQNLLLTFTPASSFVKEIREQITSAQKSKAQLEVANPGLLTMNLPETKTVAGETASPPRSESLTMLAEIQGLRARLTALKAQLEDVQKGATALGASEASIVDLQRRKAMQEGYYTNFSESLEQSHISERLGAGKISNISIIQAPSPPGKVASKLRKMMAMTLLGGIGGAFGLAFLLEFVLDRSIKRPIDVETKLTLPFFLSIPRMKLNGAHKALGQIKPPPLLPEGDPGQTPGALQKADPSSGGNGGGENIQITPWDHANKLRPFSEALRDRLINYFEINNLTHKPKLVAVTSCGEHCGVSTVAAGLAASLSETGEGNVLLVDMNHPDGTAHHFYKGDLSCGIDEALATGTRENAMVQDKLYVVTERSNAETAPSFLPTRFKHLVPKLKASDFDYIVFDMPAVSQISLTPRLSRFMDICLLVVEAEKTDLDIVKRASALLTQSRAKVGIVLNKTQNYLPRWLHQEL